MQKIALAYITAPDQECAALLAKGLVEARLAACVNILPLTSSIYAWQGAIEESKEFLLLAKCAAARYPDLEAWVKKRHPYDTPCVMRIDVADALPAFAEWACGQTLDGEADAEA